MESGIYVNGILKIIKTLGHKMTKMAIVSSYSESCGNAAFTKILKNSIEGFFPEVKVDVIELDLKVLQSVDGFVRKKGNEHINQICNKLLNYDLVNIQLETGLYGTLPKDITNRIKKLIRSNKNISLTLHSPRIIGSMASDSRKALKKIMQLKLLSGLKEMLSSFLNSRISKMNREIIHYGVKNNCKFIVHTERAKEQIGLFFNYNEVKVHPLKMIPLEYSHNNETLQNIRTHLGINPNDKLIGMFGYLGEYKGHTDAINALKLLDSSYKLLIFGRQHPQTISSKGVKDLYTQKLIKLIGNNLNRVYFLGELNDNDFMDVAGSVDVSWLPYYENGQDGSGIASICLDLSQRVLCSASFAFDELFKLIKYDNYLRFDIGNHLEIALKTKMILSQIQTSKHSHLNDFYNLKSQAQCYVGETT